MQWLVSVVILWCMFLIRPDAIARFSSYPLMYVLDTSWCNCSFQQLSFDVCSGYVLGQLLVSVVTLWYMFWIRPGAIARFSSYPLMNVLDTSWGKWRDSLLVSIVTIWCVFWIRPGAIVRFCSYPLMCVLNTSWGNWRDSLLVSVVNLWCMFWIRPGAVARFSSYPFMYVLDTSWCNCSFQ